MKSQKKEKLDEVETEKQDSDKPSQEFIGTYNQAPHFLRDNKFIIKGYRINYDSPKKIIKSLFRIHNESVNIWTHLIGFLLMASILCYVLFYISPESKMEYKNKFTILMDQYIHKLQNISLLNDLKIDTNETLSRISQSFHQSYQQVLNIANTKLIEANYTIDEYKAILKHKFDGLLIQFKTIKQEFQNKALANILDSVVHATEYINSTLLNQFQVKLISLKNKFIQITDSQQFSFIQINASPNPHSIQRWPLFIFVLSAMGCLSLSSLFHLFYPMSTFYYAILTRCDYAGINLLIAGSTFPLLFYGMYCKMNLALFYLTLITIIGAVLFTISLFDWMHTESNRKFKAICYGGYGIFVSVPMFHMAINQILFEDLDPFSFKELIPIYLCVGVSYLGGLYVYTVRCPERYHPGKYDVCGHSHQIWHLCVIAGIIFTYIASLTIFEQRKIHSCPA